MADINIKVGDLVTSSAPTNINGDPLADWTRDASKYQFVVMAIEDDNVQIGLEIEGSVQETDWVKMEYLTLYKSAEENDPMVGVKVRSIATYDINGNYLVDWTREIDLVITKVSGNNYELTPVVGGASFWVNSSLVQLIPDSGETDPDNPSPESTEIKKGDTVQAKSDLSQWYDINGTKLASWTLKSSFIVMEVNGDRIRIGNGTQTTAWVNRSDLQLKSSAEDSPTPSSGDIQVGDVVRTTARKDSLNGKTLKSWINEKDLDVIAIKGDLYALGDKSLPEGQNITCHVTREYITLIKSADGTVKPGTDIDPSETEVTIADEDQLTSSEIDSALASLLDNYVTSDMLKYNMRLFGLPHQYSDYCDYRSYYSTDTGSKRLKIGRKFIENIMLEAPVVTIVPGKPLYLPAAKNKQATSYALLSAANGNMSSLLAKSEIENNNKLYEKLRFYDFQQDYYTYMKYVNILCAVAASFLEIGDREIDGTKLVNYDWKNYRWNAERYTRATENILAATRESVIGFVDKLKIWGKTFLNNLTSDGEDSVTTEQNGVLSQLSGDSDTATKDTDMLENLESLLTQVNFVQFYIDPTSGFSESADNQVTTSKLEGIMDSGSELMKEVSFMANSGGIDASELAGVVNEGMDYMNQKLFSSSTGSISGVLSRIMSSASNVVKGDNMIFPQIYQSSSYSKTYNISVDLRCPYGNTLSYFMNILVPLFHLLALCIPKQTTANTYGSPFLVKAYYPGVFSCNLGMVTGLTIDKATSENSWTVDGYPNQVRVTLTIQDLYSDLSMTPAGVEDGVILFLSNSSLIEFLATNCGVNLTVPQLDTRVKLMTATINSTIASFDQSVSETIFGTMENWIASLTGV